VIVTRRPKYACQSCAGDVVQVPAPERLIENGIPTEALVAHVLIAKYADHTPLYRQAQIYDPIVGPTVIIGICRSTKGYKAK
jgi:transposase